MKTARLGGGSTGGMRTLLLCSAATCFAMPAGAKAQDAAAETQAETPAETEAETAAEASASRGSTHMAEDIVVTGTSLRGVAPVGTSVQSLDSEQLAAVGLSNTNDVLKTIPQVVDLGYGEGRGGGVQGAQGNVTQAKTVNLRGIGINATLVLVNGRRIWPSGTLGNGYDTSILATNAIGRIEVVADGASAIYGSDAVGGVINFITKRNYEGAETGLRYGFANGFDEKRISQNFGFSWGSGNLFVAGEHYERGGLMGSDRSKFVTQNLSTRGGPDLRSSRASPGTIMVGSTTYAIPHNQRGVGLTPGNFIAGTANREDINDTRSLLVDQNQDTLFASLHQDIGTKFSVWAQGMYSDRDYLGYGTSLSAGAATAQLTVPRSNPFFVHPSNPTAATVSVLYSFSDAFPFYARGGEEGYQLAGGFAWDVFADWSVEGFGTYSYNDAYRKADQLLSANLAAVLSDRNPATAFNPFCDARAFSDCNNPATLDKLRGYNRIGAVFRAQNYQLKASGSLIELPGGPLAIAVGAEIFKPELATTLTFLTTTVAPTERNVFSKRTVKAAFAEAVIPIFSDANGRPLLEQLTLSAAVRHEDYSDFGTTTNPKFGLTWAPFEGLKLRGTYGTSFRAPTLAESEVETSATYSAIDILDPTTNSLVRAIQLVGGREGLGPETAKTYTFGADVAPPDIPGLRASVTYYNINFSNRIGSVSVSNIIQNPTVYAAYLVRDPDNAAVLEIMNSPFFRTIPEDPNNIALIIDARTTNIGAVKQDGLDLTLNYDFTKWGADWRTGITATQILNASTSVAEALGFVDVLDRINNPVSFRGRGTLGFTADRWSFDMFVNHVGGYVNDTISPSQRVKPWTTFDLSAAYVIPEDVGGILSGVRFGLNIINAFNQDPPFVINTTAAAEGFYDSQNASAIGRFIAFEISKKW